MSSHPKRFYFLKDLFMNFMYVNTLSAHQKTATDRHALPSGHWELNSGLLEEECILLTISPAPKPQTLNGSGFLKFKWE